jgi:hypothetical protein
MADRIMYLIYSFLKSNVLVLWTENCSLGAWGLLTPQNAKILRISPVRNENYGTIALYAIILGSVIDLGPVIVRHLVSFIKS